MAKLQNGTQFDNPSFDVSFGDYLLVNKFQVINDGKFLKFIKGKIVLYVYNNSVDVFEFIDAPGITTDQKWSHKNSVTGLPENIFKWILLMDALGVQNMSEFISNASLEGNQMHKEALFIMQSIKFQNFKATA